MWKHTNVSFGIVSLLKKIWLSDSIFKHLSLFRWACADIDCRGSFIIQWLQGPDKGIPHALRRCLSVPLPAQPFWSWASLSFAPRKLGIPSLVASWAYWVPFACLLRYLLSSGFQRLPPTHMEDSGLLRRQVSAEVQPGLPWFSVASSWCLGTSLIRGALPAAH